MPAKVVWMDVDHAGQPRMTVGTGDATGEFETLTISITIGDVGCMTANATLTGTSIGDIAIATGTVGKPGIAAAAKRGKQ